ncbi:MAG: hypothetical protein IPL35_05740 [Sphingobacteriales bacterium]|nr:hypothetical protein [Sphingobacteriales bacterium]
MIFLFEYSPLSFAQATIPYSIPIHSLPEVAIHSPRATPSPPPHLLHIFYSDLLPPQSPPQLLSENTPFYPPLRSRNVLPPLLFGERRRSIPPSLLNGFNLQSP